MLFKKAGLIPYSLLLLLVSIPARAGVGEKTNPVCSVHCSRCYGPEDSHDACPLKEGGILVKREDEFQPRLSANLGECAACFAWELFLSHSVSAEHAEHYGSVQEPVKSGELGPTIWERWKSVDEIFEPGKAECDGSGKDVLSIKNALSEKLESSLDPRLQCMRGVLVSQDAKRVWAEVFVNKTLEQYLERDPVPPPGRGKFDEFSAVFRTAWVEMPETSSKDFYIRKKWLFDEDTKKCSSSRVDMALVGVNIWLRTRVSGEIFWISIEHERNTPFAYGSGECKQSSAAWTFYDPHHTGAVNRLHPRGTKPLEPTQIKRLSPLNGRYRIVNSSWQDMMEGSVWSHYMVVGAQWGVGRLGGDPPSGERRLANAVLEPSCQQLSGMLVDRHGISFPIEFESWVDDVIDQHWRGEDPERLRPLLRRLRRYLDGLLTNLDQGCSNCHGNKLISGDDLVPQGLLLEPFDATFLYDRNPESNNTSDE